MDERPSTFTAFAGDRLLVAGPVEEVVRRARRRLDREPQAALLFFEDATGAQVDFDLRGTAEEAVARLPSHPLLAPKGRPRSGPGRPRLGVVAREVTLLPRHWEWLESQAGGASAVLRRLVEEARKAEPDPGRERRAKEAASRVMTALAGNLPGYEEASRALFAGDTARLADLTRPWPRDVRSYLLRLAKGNQET